MGDLKAMRADADARLAQAKLEADVLERIDAFGADMGALGVTFEVLRLDAAQIEISAVIVGLGNPAVEAACVAVGRAGGFPQADLGMPLRFVRGGVPFVEKALVGEVTSIAVPDEVERGHAVDETAPEVDRPAVSKPAPAAPKPAPKIVTGRWSDAEVARAHKMLDAGSTSGEVAKALGRGANAVSVKVAKMRAQRGDAKWRAARAGETVAPPPRPTAPAKRKLVPGKDRVQAPAAKPKVSKPAPAAAPKTAKPAAAVPFAQRAGVASLPPRAAPAAAAAPVSGAKGERPYAERAIIAHLDAVGYADGWNAERDFELVEEICRGSNLAVVATELQIGFAAAQARWRQLNAHIGDTGHQARLVRILKERANG